MEKNLLYFLLGNVEMAKLTTQQLIELSEDGELRKSLLEDLSGYESFYNKIIAAKQSGEELKGVSPLAKFSTKATMMFETFRDKSTHKMCEMLIKGFEMGIADANENIELAHKANERQEVIDMATDYRNFLQQSMEKYKNFK